MNFNEYQETAHQTAVYPRKNALAYLATGLAGETGEICSKFAKSLRGDADNMTSEELLAHVVSIKGELGDILWFVSEIATLYGWALADVAEMNTEKLRDRMERNVIKGSGDNR